MGRQLRRWETKGNMETQSPGLGVRSPGCQLLFCHRDRHFSSLGLSFPGAYDLYSLSNPIIPGS